MLSSPFMLSEYGDTAFQLSVPHSFCRGLFIVSVGSLHVGSVPKVSQKAGAFGDMTAFLELNYFSNSFIWDRLFEKAIPSVQWSKSWLYAKQCLLNSPHIFYSVACCLTISNWKVARLKIRSEKILVPFLAFQPNFTLSNCAASWFLLPI